MSLHRMPLQKKQTIPLTFIFLLNSYKSVQEQNAFKHFASSVQFALCKQH